MTIPGRARAAPELFDLVRSEYGLSWEGEPRDCGGVNLNLLLPTPEGGHIVRVYAPWTSLERLAAIQMVRCSLIDAGLPFVPAVATLGGEASISFDGRVVEVEPYRPGGNMKIEQLPTGVRMLARVHDALRTIDAGPHACEAAHPNHIDAELALAWTVQGAEAIRSERVSDDEMRTADLAEELASVLRPRELACADELPKQLVHGDFWDNNVLFHAGERGHPDHVGVLLDLDFMGERPRVDDLALTLYYTNSTLEIEGWDEQVRRAMSSDIVAAYDEEGRLTDAEREALPLALARTVLCFVGMIPLIDTEESRRRHVRMSRPDIEWSLDIVRNLDRWQDAFSARR